MFCNQWLSVRCKCQAWYVCILKCIKCDSLKVYFEKCVHIENNPKFKHHSLLSSVQYQEMSRQESLILESFHPRGNSVGLKRSSMHFPLECSLLPALTATCWNIRRGIAQKENTRTKAAKGFLKPTLCHQQWVSLGTQGDRCLIPGPGREARTVASAALNACVHTSLSLAGNSALEGGTPALA